MRSSFLERHGRRVKKFIMSLVHFLDIHVSFIGSLAEVYSRGDLGRNLARLFNFGASDESVDVDILTRKKLIRDCLDVRDRICVMEGFDNEDMNFFIEFVCTE